MPKLTIETLKQEAQAFSQIESHHKEKSLFGITDGKAVGTYLEHKFKDHLRNKYDFEEGNSASGIDFPALNVDIKFTGIVQPELDYPFKSARQRIYGLGYSLLVFVYEKSVNRKSKTTNLYISHILFLTPDKTGDFQMTQGIIDILKNDYYKDDLTAFMFDSRLLFDESEVGKLADEILSTPPKMSFVMTSDDLRWRLRYFGMLERGGEMYDDILIYKA